MRTNRLAYKAAAPLHAIAGTAEEKAKAVAALTNRHAVAIETFKGLASRNREGHVPGRSLQDYYCIGCDVPDGNLRAEVFSLAAYPLHQVAIQELLDKQLTLQCYFPQTYEQGAGVGPGGIIGTQPANAWEAPDVTASRSLKYWNWVDATGSVYLPEDEAEIALWKLSYAAFPQGKYWLAQLPDTLPEEGLPFPQELRHDLHALLGVPAMQRLVARHLNKDVLLLDSTRIIERSALHWGLLAG